MSIGKGNAGMSKEALAVHNLLPKLSAAELEAVRKAIGFLQSVGGAPSGKTRKEQASETWAEQAVYVIAKVCQEKGTDFSSPAALKASPQFKAMQAKFREDDGALENYFKNAVDRNRVQAQALLRVGVVLLIEAMKEQELPIAARYVMTSIHRVPSVIGRAFPGYAESGMLGLVIGLSQKGNRNVRKE